MERLPGRQRYAPFYIGEDFPKLQFLEKTEYFINMVVAGFLALISAGVIAYLALSKNTGASLKRIAIIALVFICLAFSVCSMLLFLSSSYITTKKGAVDFPAVPINQGKDITPLLIAAIVVLLFMILVIVMYFREKNHKRKNKQEKINGQHNQKN